MVETDGVLMCFFVLPNSNYKMMLYSVHDTTMAPLLLVLGLFDNKWPEFAADLAFELYRDKVLIIITHSLIFASFIGQNTSCDTKTDCGYQVIPILRFVIRGRKSLFQVLTFQI